MTQVNLPKLGESILGATVVRWLKKVGDHVALDEPLLEVATDKVNSEIPSPVAGTLQQILAQVDEEIEVGAALAIIGAEEAKKTIVPATPAVQTSRDDAFSPAVLRLAQQEGVDLATLRQIEGTGEGGRVTKKDLEGFVKNRRQPICPAVAKQSSNVEPLPCQYANEERVPLTGMRKAIADNMVRSFYEAPHASFITEIDVTDPMRLIAEQKERFLQTHGVKLTITSFIIQALTKALQQFPMLNASLEKDTIICKRYVNLGIAVNLDKGLIVPVIKNCQDRNLISIAKSVAELSSKARSHKLAPDDIQGGTMTLTNFGMTGTLIGVPIIRYPEVAIMGVGAVQKRVVVREDESLAIRQMLYISLTFDHRVVDGVYVCEFLSVFKRQLESISTT
ncbi:MAG: 2-oxo acid dehydrogenase subunit E2 [Verrucomicrobia bacterium]|nr:2-oxo acid dehydrogenase subunit E2 [Verrucomicrobiota bacterium]MBS0646604.1 2-oxo acid dehydrogenase subunit E2 [Verrucomicrobiota bacterium]